MKILVWSDRGVFLDELVRKLYKEKHEIYLVLNVKRKQERRTKGVFEEYYLEYENDHIITMIQNIQPDICMFLVDIYPRLNQNTKYVSYVTGLTNAVLSAKQAKVGSFYYLSTVHVFDLNDKEVSDHTRPVRGENTNRILSCEQICTMNEDEGFHPVIIRMGEIYGDTSDKITKDNREEIIPRLVKAYRKQETAQIREQYHSCIYYKDACELIYRIVSAGAESGKYILAAQGAVYSEQEAADIFNKRAGIEIQEASSGRVGTRQVYQSDILKRLGYQDRYTLEKGLEEMSSSLQKEEKGKDIRSEGAKRFLTYGETFLFFLLIQLFIRATSGFSFHNVMDVYMLFVLCIAVVHGFSQTIFAAFLCILGRTMFSGADFALVGLDYYYWCLQLVIVATLAGFVKDKYKRKSQDLNDEAEYLKYELEYYKQLNQNGQEIKEIYEERLLNYKDSFARIAEIVSGLDALDSQKVVFDAVDVIERIMSCRQVCIYTVDERSGFSRLLASSTGTSNLGKTFNLKDHEAVYEVLRRDEVFVNRNMDPALPMLMKATKDQQGISGILMVYDVDFLKYGQQQVNTFSILCNLIEKSLLRAYTYLEDVKHDKYYGDTSIMLWNAYRNILELYIYGESKGLLEYTMLKLILPDGDKNLLKGNIRTTDYLGQKDEDTYFALLTNTNISEAEIVLKRCRSKGILAEVVEKNKGEAMDEVFPEFV